MKKVVAAVKKKKKKVMFESDCWQMSHVNSTCHSTVVNHLREIVIWLETKLIFMHNVEFIL